MIEPRDPVLGAVRVNLKTGTVWRYYDEDPIYLGPFPGDEDTCIIRTVGYQENAAQATTLLRRDVEDGEQWATVYMEQGPPTDVVTGLGPEDECVIPCTLVSPLIPLSPRPDVKGMINRVLIHGYFRTVVEVEDEVETTLGCYLSIYSGSKGGSLDESPLRVIPFQSDGTTMLNLHFTPVFDYFVRLHIWTPSQFMLFSPIIINPW